MRNNKKTVILIEVVLAIMVIILAILMVGDKRGETLGKVSVIVQDPDDNQWSAFKYGLKMAAQDQKIELMVVSTGDRLTVEEEQRIIEREIAKGTDAVIIEPLPRDGAEEMLEGLSEKIPMVLVEHGQAEKKKEANTDTEIPVTEPDHYSMGATLAKEAAKDHHGKLEGKRVGLFSDTTNSKAVAQREKGLRDVLESEGATIKWIISGDFRGVESTFLKQQPLVDFVFALDDSSLTLVGEYASSNELNGATVYGIGNSTEAIYYLDTGVVQCIVVPDEFSVGYQSLSEVAAHLRYSSYDIESEKISYTTIRKEELFSKENQEILFTMSQ